MIQERYLSTHKKEVLSNYKKTTNSSNQSSIATRLLSMYSEDVIVDLDDELLFEKLVGEPRSKCSLKLSTKINYMQSIRRFQRFLKGEVRNLEL